MNKMYEPSGHRSRDISCMNPVGTLGSKWSLSREQKKLIQGAAGSLVKKAMEHSQKVREQEAREQFILSRLRERGP